MFEIYNKVLERLLQLICIHVFKIRSPKNCVDLHSHKSNFSLVPAHGRFNMGLYENRVGKNLPATDTPIWVCVKIGMLNT